MSNNQAINKHQSLEQNLEAPIQSKTLGDMRVNTRKSMSMRMGAQVIVSVTVVTQD